MIVSSAMMILYLLIIFINVLHWKIPFLRNNDHRNWIKISHGYLFYNQYAHLFQRNKYYLPQSGFWTNNIFWVLLISYFSEVLFCFELVPIDQRFLTCVDVIHGCWSAWWYFCFFIQMDGWQEKPVRTSKCQPNRMALISWNVTRSSWDDFF